MKTQQRWMWLACVLWFISAGTVAVLMVVDPLRHSVDWVYHDAVENWRAHEAVYTHPSGFNYLPAFLPVFGLFAWLPRALGNTLWRWAAFAGIGLGLWQCCGFMTKNRSQSFAVVSGLALCVSLSALRNGQSSAQLAACLVLAAWCLQRQCWWLATLWLCLSLVCKPLGIAAIGLAVMAFPRLWWRLAVGVALVILLPYCVAPPSYVSQLYREFYRNIVECFDTGDRTFADVNGFLTLLNLELTGWPSMIVRVASGAAMAVGCWFVGRLVADIRRVLFWLGFTGIYIILFTPMNEANSYVILGPAFGLWAWWFSENGAGRAALVTAMMPVSMALLPSLVRPIVEKDGSNEFLKFWSPFMTLIFLGLVLWQVKVALSALRPDRSRRAGEAKRATGGDWHSPQHDQASDAP